MMNARRFQFGVILVIASVMGCTESNTVILPTATAPNSADAAKIRSGFEMGVPTGSGVEAGVPTDSASTASTPSPTGFATLRGSFTLEGDPPAPVVLTVDKDANVCAPGDKPVEDKDFVFDATSQGIANVVIFVENCPEEWVHESAKPGNEAEVIFDQEKCVFLTRMVVMQTSQKLRVLNSDPVGHNLKVASFNQTIPSGGFAIYQPLKEMRAPEEMACSIHPWMKAWMLTRDNGYFAVSKEDGSFELPNLPAGVKLDFRVWHERSKAVTGATIDGEEQKWSKGRMSHTLEPDQDFNLGVIKLNSSLFN